MTKRKLKISLLKRKSSRFELIFRIEDQEGDKNIKLDQRASNEGENQTSFASIASGLIDQNSKSPLEMLKDQDEETNRTLKYILFACAGMTTGYTFSLMIAQIDIFDAVFVNMDYSFYSVSPEYLNIPFAIIFTRYLVAKQVKLMTRLLVCIALFTIFFFSIPFMTFCFKSSY